MRQLGGGVASYWRMAFGLALEEIAALAGSRPKARAPARAGRYAAHAAMVVATVRNQR